MMSAARTSFGCCGVISVEDDFSLETTGALWAWVVSVRAIRFALGRLRGTVRKRDILRLSVTQAALRRESEGVDADSHACYTSFVGGKSSLPGCQEHVSCSPLVRRERGEFLSFDYTHLLDEAVFFAIGLDSGL